MRSKRKLTSVLLCALLVVACILPTGCGSKVHIDWGWADITDDSVPESYELPFGSGITFTYSGPDSWYAPASLSKNLPVWQEVTRRTGIAFKWQVQPSTQWNTSMSTRINAGGKLPDIMGLPNWHDANVARYAKEKVVIPLNELINKYAPNIKRILKENPDIRRQMTAPDGCIYSLDEFFEAPEYYTAVIIREDWLLECGYAPGWVPKTVAEFEDVMRKFKNRPGQNASFPTIPLACSEDDEYEFFASGFGLSAPLQNTVIEKTADGKEVAVYQRATDEYGTFIRWLNGLYSTGLLWQDYQAANQTAFESLILRDQVGITTASGSYMDKYNALLKGEGITTTLPNGTIVEAKYIMINPPVDSQGKLRLLRRSKLGGQIGISSDCSDPVAAIRLMDYLWANNEGVMLLHYGLDATDAARYGVAATYEMTDGAEPRPVLTDWVSDNPDGLDAASALRSIGAWPSLFDHQTKDFMEAFNSPQVIEYVHANNAMHADPDSYFRWEDPYPRILASTEEQNNPALNATALGTYSKEVCMKIILGQRTDSYVTYQQNMYNVYGLQKYLDARKIQYDRFMCL